MTREECIKTLKRSMERFLFDPGAGEATSPERLNGPDRMAFEAMEYAVGFMESHPRRGARSWFYTFGTDPLYPFGLGEYVEVHADSEKEADGKFRDRFPDRPGSNVLNCAFIYSEKAWEKVRGEYYRGKAPSAVID